MLLSRSSLLLDLPRNDIYPIQIVLYHFTAASSSVQSSRVGMIVFVFVALTNFSDCFLAPQDHFLFFHFQLNWLILWTRTSLLTYFLSFSFQVHYSDCFVQANNSQNS